MRYTHRSSRGVALGMAVGLLPHPDRTFPRRGIRQSRSWWAYVPSECGIWRDKGGYLWMSLGVRWLQWGPMGQAQCDS